MNASSGQIVALGHLPGVYQSAPRAELFAVLSAVSWVRFSRVFAVIWGDSFSVAEGLRLLLEGCEPAAHGDNQDLWKRIRDQATELQPGQVRVQHVTSHLDPALCETAFEEWVARWNNYVDTVATVVNVNRTWTFQRTFQRALLYAEDTASLLRSLRHVYLRIADLAETSSRHRSEALFEEDVVVADLALPRGLPREEAMADRLPLTWRQEIAQIFPAHLQQTARKFVQLLIDQDACSNLEFRISWLELVGLFWESDLSVWSSDGLLDPRIPASTPTVAEQLRQIRRIGSKFLHHFGLSHLLVFRLSGVHLGYGFPLTVCGLGFPVRGFRVPIHC